VKLGYVPLNSAEWKYISKEAKLLVKRMLTYDPDQRITAQEALSSKWIQILSKNDCLSVD